MKLPPNEIMAESFRIIDALAGAHTFGALEWPIVRRMIHASGDIELLHSVRFRSDAASMGIRAFREGVPIVTDVRMVAVGINKSLLESMNVALHCFIDDPEVARMAEAQGTTRSACAMTKAIAEIGDAVYVIGNAPTALLALCEAIREERVRPRLIVAMPVGFVSVIDSKERALALDVPVISILGSKGGSAVAAAAVNALLDLAANWREP